MLLEGERKIYNYLEERNARWSTPEDREIYLESIRSANRIDQVMEAVRHLNEKICVVEIEYKYVVEDDNQETTTYDSKTRKIQSKIYQLLQPQCGV
jgi:arabinogalactan endo-1,4-beta-galactosidase